MAIKLFKVLVLGLALFAAPSFAKTPPTEAEYLEAATAAKSFINTHWTEPKRFTVGTLEISGDYALINYLDNGGAGGQMLLQHVEKQWRFVLSDGGVQTVESLQAAGVPGLDAYQLIKATTN